MRQLTEHVKLFGNGNFNFYLVGDQIAALVECGTQAGASIFAQQWAQMEQKPEVRFIVALHSHFDHICGVPILKGLFPEAQVVTSTVGKKLLSKEKIVADLYKNDRMFSETYLQNAFIDKKPELPEPNVIPVDLVVGEGDVLTLDQNLSLKFLDAPGHSVCSIAAYLEKDQCLLVSDAAGYGFQDGTITPVFFNGFTEYTDTIQTFISYPCQALGPAHGSVILGGQVLPFLQKSLAFSQQGFDYIRQQLLQGVEEQVMARELYQRYIREGLSYYPYDMMLGAMVLLIKSVKAEM